MLANYRYQPSIGISNPNETSRLPLYAMRSQGCELRLEKSLIATGMIQLRLLRESSLCGQKDLNESKREYCSRELWKAVYGEAIRSTDGDEFPDRYYSIVTEVLNAQIARLSEKAKDRGFFDPSLDSLEIAMIFNAIAHGFFRRWLLGQYLTEEEADTLVRQQVKIIFSGVVRK